MYTGPEEGNDSNLRDTDKVLVDVAEVLEEVRNARANWPAFNSAHEGFAILKEEVDELWDIVKVNQKKRDLVKMRAEAKQVAAMAIRFMGDCTDEINGRK